MALNKLRLHYILELITIIAFDDLTYKSVTWEITLALILTTSEARNDYEVVIIKY